MLNIHPKFEDFHEVLDSAYSSGQQAFMELLSRVSADKRFWSIFWAAHRGHGELALNIARTFEIDPSSYYKRNHSIYCYNLCKVITAEGDVDAVLLLASIFELDLKRSSEYGVNLLEQLFIRISSRQCDAVINLAHTFKVNPHTNHNEGNMLHDAVCCGDADVVLKVAQVFELDPNKKDKFGNTILHEAALFGRAELIIRLVDEFKLDPYAKNTEGKTILHIAAGSPKRDCFHKLAIEYLDINTLEELSAKYFMSELFKSSKKFLEATRYTNRHNVVEACLNSLKPEHKERFLQWPLWDRLPHLHYACVRERDDLATLLVKHGCPHEGLEVLLDGNIRALRIYRIALARNNIEHSKLDLVYLARLIHAKAQYDEYYKTPYFKKDLEILISALLGGQLKAGIEKEISLANIAIGKAANLDEQSRTQQTIMHYCTVLDRYEHAKHVEGISDLVDSTNAIEGLLHNVIKQFQALQLENAQLKQDLDAQRSTYILSKPATETSPILQTPSRYTNRKTRRNSF